MRIENRNANLTLIWESDINLAISLSNLKIMLCKLKILWRWKVLGYYISITFVIL